MIYSGRLPAVIFFIRIHVEFYGAISRRCR
jgi:hypothetical protein